MKFNYSIVICTLLIACTPQASNNSPADEKGTTAQTNHSGTFPLPLIPGNITSQQESMRYALLHFWDEYNFRDTTTHNAAIGRQGFSTFLALLRQSDTATIDSASAHFWAACKSGDESFRQCNTLISDFLENPNATTRNDAMYARFLRSRLPFTDDEAMRGRIQFKIELLEKNLPGTTATDFIYLDRTGKKGSMHRLKAPLTLLLFADPDCENCHALIPRLMAERTLQNDNVKVMMVYPGDDTEAWRNNETRMPKNWMDVCSPQGEISDRLLYHIPAMPSLYLLDADKKVILKDATPEAACSEIAKRLREMKQ